MTRTRSTTLYYTPRARYRLALGQAIDADYVLESTVQLHGQSETLYFPANAKGRTISDIELVGRPYQLDTAVKIRPRDEK